MGHVENQENLFVMSNLRCRTAELNPLKPHCLFFRVQKNFKILKATYLCTTKQKEFLLVIYFVSVIEPLLKATSRLEVLDTITLKGSICLQSPNIFLFSSKHQLEKSIFYCRRKWFGCLSIWGKNKILKKTKRVVRSGKDWQVISLKSAASFENSNLNSGISYRHLDCLNNCSFITHD